MMEHKSPIIKVHLQQGGEQELYTASMNGEVRIWDLRKLVTPVKSLVNHDMTCFDVHDNTSLFAW